MSEIDSKWEERREGLIHRAILAAEKGNAPQAIESLFESRAIDSVFRIVRSKYSDLGYEDIADSIADAVNTLFFAIRDGTTVRDPKAYLCKIAANNCYDLSRRKKDHLSLEAEQEGELIEAYQMDAEKREYLRTEAIKVAKTLISKLGMENVQQVMSFIIEAVAQGAVDVTNDQIAEALGMSENAVKVNKSRGFSRLTKLAQEAGIEIDLTEFNQIVDETDED